MTEIENLRVEVCEAEQALEQLQNRLSLETARTFLLRLQQPEFAQLVWRPRGEHQYWTVGPPETLYSDLVQRWGSTTRYEEAGPTDDTGGLFELFENDGDLYVTLCCPQHLTALSDCMFDFGAAVRAERLAEAERQLLETRKTEHRLVMLIAELKSG